jgi:hypothetical protein
VETVIRDGQRERQCDGRDIVARPFTGSFRMSSKAWEISTLVLAFTVIGLAGYAYMKHGEVTALTAQLAAATKDAQDAHAQATATEAQATAEQQQLQTTQARLAAEARPDLPVNLSFRQALLSAGLVGVFRNTSGRELEFMLDLESPATGQHVRKAVVLNPNGILEIGAQQGWPFAPGHRYLLNNPAYRPVAGVVGG